MTYSIVFLPVLVVAAVVAACVVLAVRLAACRHGRAEMAEQLKTAMNAEKSAVRQLRLASHNLRTIGMTLQGHAESIESGGKPEVTGIANTATGIFDIADYMHEWIQHAPSARVLNEATLHLGSLVDEAISSIAHKMEPGRRIWHVDPEVIALRLRADQRALRYVLMRALSVAVRSSGHDDGIRLRYDNTRESISLVIERQPGQGDRVGANLYGGGPDLRLTLARELMEAHGGKFDVVPSDGRSMRVCISFPADRRRTGSDETRETLAVAAAPTDTDDREVGALAN